MFSYLLLLKVNLPCPFLSIFFYSLDPLPPDSMNKVSFHKVFSRFPHALPFPFFPGLTIFPLLPSFALRFFLIFFLILHATDPHRRVSGCVCSLISLFFPPSFLFLSSSCEASLSLFLDSTFFLDLPLPPNPPPPYFPFCPLYC